MGETGGLLTASFPFRCFPGSVTHGRCTRTRPALNARRTLRTARRVCATHQASPYPADEMFVRKFRGPGNVLGAAVQLCTLSWLGFVPDEVGRAPAAAVTRLADRLGTAVGGLYDYGVRGQTRTEHLREIARYAGRRPMLEATGRPSPGGQGRSTGLLITRWDA
jgi:hypothetical protein